MLSRVHREAPGIGLLIPFLEDKPDLSAVDDPELWQTIRDQAERQGVAPLVACAARTRVSAAERVWCDRILIASWSRYNRSLDDLEFVAATLKESSVQPLVLKGPLLASRYYNPPYLRKASRDLDFGIRECDIDHACGALMQAGYFLDSAIASARAFSHHIVMFHRDRARLELHFRISHGPFGLPVDEFFDQAIPYRLQSGTEVLILEGAAEILHLALHLACGRFAPFFHLFELRRVCRAAGPAIVRNAAIRAAECHFAGAFSLIDAAFQFCWGEPFLPPGFPMPRTWLYRRVNEELYQAYCRWSELAGARTLRSRLRGRWLDLQTTDRPSDALRQIRTLTKLAWFQMRRRGCRDMRMRE